jgi:hypothetical protein
MATTTRPAGARERSVGGMVGRALWITFKVFLIPVLCIAALIFGLAVGYAVLGHRPLSDVFDLMTWKHMYDLVFASGS